MSASEMSNPKTIDPIALGSSAFPLDEDPPLFPSTDQKVFSVAQNATWVPNEKSRETVKTIVTVALIVFFPITIAGGIIYIVCNTVVEIAKAVYALVMGEDEDCFDDDDDGFLSRYPTHPINPYPYNPTFPASSINLHPPAYKFPPFKETSNPYPQFAKGVQNVGGNQCYMNSAIQFLFANESLRQAILDKEDIADPSKNELLQSLKAIFIQMQQESANSNALGQAIASLAPLVSPEFSPGEQNDSSAFLMQLLDRLGLDLQQEKEKFFTWSQKVEQEDDGSHTIKNAKIRTSHSFIPSIEFGDANPFNGAPLPLQTFIDNLYQIHTGSISKKAATRTEQAVNAGTLYEASILRANTSDDLPKRLFYTIQTHASIQSPFGTSFTRIPRNLSGFSEISIPYYASDTAPEALAEATERTATFKVDKHQAKYQFDEAICGGDRFFGHYVCIRRIVDAGVEHFLRISDDSVKEIPKQLAETILSRSAVLVSFSLKSEEVGA